MNIKRENLLSSFLTLKLGKWHHLKVKFDYRLYFCFAPSLYQINPVFIACIFIVIVIVFSDKSHCRTFYKKQTIKTGSIQFVLPGAHAISLPPNKITLFGRFFLTLRGLVISYEMLPCFWRIFWYKKGQQLQ